MVTPASNLDDYRVLDTETVWRLIDPRYYPEDSNSPGNRIISSSTFSHNKSPSLIRSSLVSQAFVRQHFPTFGIAAMKAADVRQAGHGCLFAIEDDPDFPYWPTDAHVCVYKAPDKKRLKPGEIRGLTALAQAGLFFKPTV